MDVKLLDAFLDLVETRNFNRSAERLGVTQSTLSDRIRTLEHSIDKQLFIRSRSGTEPTPAGLRFQELARALKLQWLDARRQIQAIGTFDEFIRVGLASQVYDRVLLPFLNFIIETLPKVGAYIDIDYSDQMILDIIQGNLDLALLYSPRQLPQVYYEIISEERYVMISSIAPRLAEIEIGHYIKANHSIAFSLLHKKLLPDLENSQLAMGNLAAIIQVLSQRGGASYVTESAAARLNSKKLTMLVEDAPVISHPIYAAVHIRHRHSHTHQRLLQGLREILNDRSMTNPVVEDPI
jgi:DNA-binding transcriptional LysR family regulator